MKLVYIVIGVAAVVAVLAIGLLFLQGPQPEIIVPAEKLWAIGPLNITNTLFTAWVVMAFIIILSLLATRSMKLMPSGLQNFMEATVGFLYDQVVEIAGEKNGRRFFMVIATFFLFIIVSNWFGLLPFFNAIGKTDDVGHEIFHEIALHDEEGHTFEDEDFAAWEMKETGSFAIAGNRAETFDFKIDEGTEAGVALDRYIVALAEHFTDYEGPDLEADGVEVTPADVEAAKAALDADSNAPKFLAAEGEGHAEGEHAVESPALGESFTGVDFPDKKLGLVVPFFRGVYSDVNNTLALGICSFLIVEFWGFQALGLGYLRKFFVAPWKNPIGTFVGVLELLSEFIRIISFAFRLFGNIFAGEVLILMLTFLMPLIFVNIIYGLELFVGFIQAAVFALLTLVFATMAVEHHGDEEHHDGHDDDGAADAHHHTGVAQAH
ncbi:MAG TPA: F0F1 ATP synthase subunit A [Gemmatimonadales bacterium]|nr:F0F1 ATP synthase subunit A [Gemmatimonadales bacterium]